MKYTDHQIDQIRELLIEDATESIRDGDFDIEDIARNGLIGFDHRDDDRIIEEFESRYDEEDRERFLENT